MFETRRVRGLRRGRVLGRGWGGSCGNIADAHVKHRGEGGMERNLWQGSRNLETRSESHWRHGELSRSLARSLTYTRTHVRAHTHIYSHY